MQGTDDEHASLLAPLGQEGQLASIPVSRSTNRAGAGAITGPERDVTLSLSSLAGALSDCRLEERSQVVLRWPRSR